MTIDFRRHFSDHAGHYADRVAPLFAVTHRYLESWAADLPTTRVLDVACGDGRAAAAIAAQGHDVLACDSSAPLARRAARVSELVLRCDAHALPLRDRSMGAVVCNLGLQFFDRPVVALREMARVVRRGNPILLTMPDRTVETGFSSGIPVAGLIGSAELEVVAERVISERVHLHDVPTLVAVWRVELGNRQEVAEASDEELAELAGVLLERENGGAGVPLGFRVYHCRAG
jgi:SAM-dependent methyltransferase